VPALVMRVRGVGKATEFNVGDIEGEDVDESIEGL
jgi:hypothetical protein